MPPSNISRVVLPKLAAKKIEWKGWHGFRRGVATELHRNCVSDFVIQKALRHANIVVTQESYIKTVPEVVIDAMGVLAKKRKGRVEPPEPAHESSTNATIAPEEGRVAA